MTKDDIMLMAQKAGPLTQGPFTEWCKRFANLVAAAEAAKWTKGAKISIPTKTMEQEFSVYHYRGYEAGKALIPAAVAAEREACAKVCEAQGEYGDEQYAAAIRARGEQT